ncbi:MAG TPA: carbohydrate ABC transporter permease [Microlunatus sp.]
MTKNDQVATTIRSEPSTKSGRIRHRLVRIGAQLFLLVCAIIWTYPVYGAILNSVKTNPEVLSGSVSLLPKGFEWSMLLPSGWSQLGAVFHFENYGEAWYAASFGQFFGNSVILTIADVFLVVAMSSMSGYVLGRYKFPGRRIIIGAFAVSAFLPEGYTIIPIWEVIRALRIEDNIAGLILAVSSGGHLLYILLFAAFFAGLPNELEESAVMDGAGFFRVFATIMLPLAKPALATVAILEMIRAWNDFFIPLVFTANQPNLQTIAVGLYTQFQGTNQVDLATMAAGVVIAFMPIVIVYVLLQRYFVEGIAGAVKN